MYSYDYCNAAFVIGIELNSKTVKTYGIFLKESSIGLFINNETNSLYYTNRTTNFGKYRLVMFAMAKLMEMEVINQNKVVLYLFNNIKAI